MSQMQTDYITDFANVNGYTFWCWNCNVLKWLVTMATDFLDHCINSLPPGRPGCHFKTAIFNLVLLIGFLRSSNDNIPRWMPWDLMDDKSRLVEVMAWCHQATSQYLSQCWPRSISPYDVTRPQWINRQSGTSTILATKYYRYETINISLYLKKKII